ncbi:right-handed parallel beta-helix repeat-containing protein [Polaribacter batillariae]|uniref:Right-handed parallel beta-helix repeat-containing protein n=1 Tax=Polaribacter batillariae TaxID=2808900 RepID=A0ABX7STR7_9FLAO|nr:right-handed parallel beta-helix repeat-containing protein [Polaribacter batillariae]QTD37644.1 right-handed parallel beta-helix repeat-containing protein [Polaribacter batillariae]
MKMYRLFVIYYYCVISFFIWSCNNVQNSTSTENSYPEIHNRVFSKTGVTYYIDPNIGNDTNSGLEKAHPWKTFKPVNELQLTEGNTIEILSIGDFKESLFLTGKGTKENPITVKFATGTYNFYPKNAYKKKFQISNTNDAPDSLKSVAFYLLNAENVHLNGNGAEIVFRGKVMEMGIENSKNINIQNLSFDYKRPTVSEFKVVQTTKHFADIQIHPDSKYSIVDSTLTWVGENWQHKVQPLWQEFNPKAKTVIRKYMPSKKLRFLEMENSKVRMFFDKNLGFVAGYTYQNRNTFRDYAAFFTDSSKNITWKNVTIHFMHGMGVVSQFSENLTFNNFSVKPKDNSKRTCAAWADILHFSGCKGDIIIKNSFLSAANDDAINIHGTHLRIVEKLSNRKIKVRFMHPQTFGFEAFHEGDSIEFIRNTTLIPYSKNKIATANLLNPKEMELTLENPISTDIHLEDVLENTTWTPNVTILNNTITRIPTRGILVTSRGKTRIENNEFIKTSMSGILIANDANSWFESGYVTDVTIKNNRFMECGEPVINIRPENTEIIKERFVHKNIRISDNQFNIKKGKVLYAKNIENIDFTRNTIKTKDRIQLKDILHFSASKNIEIKNNKIY